MRTCLVIDFVIEFLVEKDKKGAKKNYFRFPSSRLLFFSLSLARLVFVSFVWWIFFLFSLWKFRFFSILPGNFWFYFIIEFALFQEFFPFIVDFFDSWVDSSWSHKTTNYQMKTLKPWKDTASQESPLPATLLKLRIISCFLVPPGPNRIDCLTAQHQ